MIEALLNKPSTKPDFGSVGSMLSSSVLTRAKSFMPEFITTTDRILSDPNNHRMDINIKDQSIPFDQPEEVQLPG